MTVQTADSHLGISAVISGGFTTYLQIGAEQVCGTASSNTGAVRGGGLEGFSEHRVAVYTVHTYSVVLSNFSCVCLSLPFRSDQASCRFWSTSILLGIAVLSAAVYTPGLQALMGGKRPVFWLFSFILQSSRVRTQLL